MPSIRQFDELHPNVSWNIYFEGYTSPGKKISPIHTKLKYILLFRQNKPRHLSKNERRRAETERRKNIDHLFHCKMKDASRDVMSYIYSVWCTVRSTHQPTKADLPKCKENNIFIIHTSILIIIQFINGRRKREKRGAVA